MSPDWLSSNGVIRVHGQWKGLGVKFRGRGISVKKSLVL